MTINQFDRHNYRGAAHTVPIACCTSNSHSSNSIIFLPQLTGNKHTLAHHPTLICSLGQIHMTNATSINPSPRVALPRTPTQPVGYVQRIAKTFQKLFIRSTKWKALWSLGILRWLSGLLLGWPESVGCLVGTCFCCL